MLHCKRRLMWNISKNMTYTPYLFCRNRDLGTISVYGGYASANTRCAGACVVAMATCWCGSPTGGEVGAARRGTARQWRRCTPVGMGTSGTRRGFMMPSSGISNLGICRQVEMRWILTCLRALERSALRGGTCSRGESRRNLGLSGAVPAGALYRCPTAG